jgi:ubiquitin carboxyl-terminal hydrolase 7
MSTFVYRVEVLAEDQLCATVPDYMHFLFHKRVIRFCPIENNPDMEFELTLQTTMTYDQVATKVAKKLNADSDKILLHLPGREERRSIRRYPTLTLGDIEKSNFNTNSYIGRLSYEVLDISLAELENNRLIRITWFSPSLSHGTFEEFFLPKRSLISDVVRQLETRGATFKSDSGSRRVRIFESIDNKFHQEFDMNDTISSISNSGRLCAEEIPEEELSPGPGDSFVKVFQYQRDTSRTHSVPFRFLVIKDESFEEMKKRLQRRTGINDKDWAKVKVSIVSAFSTRLIENGKAQM